MDGEKGVVRVNLKGVFATYKRMRDGSRKTYYYHRATGKRLRGEPGSSDFITDFASAEATLIPHRITETLSGLIRDYTLSVKFEQLAMTTAVIAEC